MFAYEVSPAYLRRDLIREKLQENDITGRILALVSVDKGEN